MRTPTRKTPTQRTPVQEMPEQSGRAGFTLLEIVVAVTVFAVLLLTLARGTQFGLAAFDRQTRMAATAGRLEAVDALLRRLVSGLDPGTQVDGSTVTGAPHALAFRAPLPTGRTVDGRPEMADLRLSVDANHRLMLVWIPYRHVNRTGPAPKPDSAVLLDRVERIDLDYWSDDAWHPRWDDRMPPALIRIRIVFPDGDERRWPDIVAAPEREQG